MPAAVERKTEHVKILMDLGYDPWEIENDADMLSVLKAAINDLIRENPKDGRIEILNNAVKGLRKPKFKEKKTRLDKDKVMGRKSKKETTSVNKNKGSSVVNKSKVMGKDLEGDNDKENKISNFLNTEVKSRLDDINNSLGSILKLLKERENAAENRDDDMREAVSTAKKSRREDKLEGKKGLGDKLKDKVMGQVEKTAGNFFQRILQFALFTWLGSAVNTIIRIIKDPMSLLDPMLQFFNLFIGFQNFIMRAMWSITGAPINEVIKGVEGGVNFVIESVNKASSLLFIPPLPTVTLPKIPGPFQIPYIPLSKSAQGKTEFTGGIDTKGTPFEAASGGGIVGQNADELKAVPEKDGPTKEEMKGEKGEKGDQGIQGASTGGVVLGLEDGGDVPEMSMQQQIMRQTDETGTFGEAGSSISTFQATPEQRHASYKEMGIPSMELWDGSVVPDVGKMGAEKIPAALAQTREMLVNDGAPPENIAKLDELIASPDVQPAAIQNSINRIVPGSQEQVLGDLGDDISAKAKMSGGGIVQPMAGGGVVNAKDISAAGGGKVESNSGIKIKGMGADTQLLAAKPGESVLQPGVREKIFRDTGKDVLAYNKGPNANRPTVSNTNNITAASTGGIVNSRTPLLPKVTRMNVGGIVPAPYPEGDDILNAYPMMGYKGGGDVVDAKLTPGEIVMNEMQQRRMKKQSGFDPASFVPPAQPGKVKFASGGKVAKGMDIPTPNKKSGGVIVIGGGDQTPPPPQSSGGSGGGDTVPRIPSTDPHNIMTSVVKTIYNMVG